MDNTRQDSDSESGSHSFETENGFSPQSEENEQPTTSPIDRPQTNVSQLSNAPKRRKRKTDVSSYDFESTIKELQVRSAERHEQMKKLTEIPKQLSEMQSWCAALATTLEKMPSMDQIEMKMTIGNLVWKRELEVLKRNENGSVLATTNTSTNTFSNEFMTNGNNDRNYYDEYDNYPTPRTLSMRISPLNEYQYPDYAESNMNKYDAPASALNTTTHTESYAPVYTDL